MEGSFADAVRYGFKRARWRRLWREQIQEYLTAAIQNMMKLLRYVKERGALRHPALRGGPGAAQGLANRFRGCSKASPVEWGLCSLVRPSKALVAHPMPSTTEK
ncbi:MAG: hypothetical protein IPI61_08460 [Syntrophaceae bacterium]|nr:hypothetical protein [Syntrophaceae bacterium]